VALEFEYCIYRKLVRNVIWHAYGECWANVGRMLGECWADSGGYTLRMQRLRISSSRFLAKRQVASRLRYWVLIQNRLPFFFILRIDKSPRDFVAALEFVSR